ncbi:MAG: site-specific DNA-methyltransferase [Candidatus Woesearchaeota archaeon]|nr:site-specific DNA-methyltransferase [Candidatus Woesearchaeota archaeon]
MNKLKQTLVKTLKSEPLFLDSESGELNYIKIKDSADSIDKKLIILLADNKELKEKFFTKIKDVYVFNIQGFKFFLDESKVDNSYTKYANEIGLADKNGLLENVSDVVLDFPFKDCVLEGGQSTEEGTDTYFEYDIVVTKAQEKQGLKAKAYNQKTTKRNEILFNQILAHDEIDRLYDRKALVNWKRFTKDNKKDGEAVKEIKRDKTGLIQENLIIKGNNLLALHSLKSEFAGKIKLIYIDPPYNPPSSNNTFTYNNNFNHSTWLTFMKNRIEVAQDLLSDKGAMIIAIDENEQAYLGVLIDELFKGYENHCVTIVHNPRGVQGTNFSYTSEYAFFIFPKGTKTIKNRKIVEEDISFSNLRNWGGESERHSAKNCFYSILVDKCTKQVIDFGDVCDDKFHPKINIHNGDFVEVYPVDKEGVERKWRYARQSAEEIKDLLAVTEKDGVYDIQIGKDFGQYKTVWIDKRYDANEYGTKLVKDLVPESNFSFPKSLWNVYDAIYAVIQDDTEAIVLDYHAGSGTTGHAVLNLNEEDKGNRKFILIEQMDYIQTVTAPRIKEVLKRSKSKDDFIYLELAKWNEKAKEEIQNAKDLPALVKLFDTLYERYFLNYNVKIKDFKEKITKEENFKKLTLAQQKKIFLIMLDLNQMYVNESEIADKKYGISTEDQKLTKAFYSKK